MLLAVGLLYVRGPAPETRPVTPAVTGGPAPHLPPWSRALAEARRNDVPEDPTAEIAPPEPTVRAIGPSTAAFDSPAAAEDYVRDRVVGLFEAVAPEIDPRDIVYTCEPEGRICTFEGPWPEDGFLKRWIRAISDGRTGTEAMGGVRFSELVQVDLDGRPHFRVVAHAP